MNCIKPAYFSLWREISDPLIHYDLEIVGDNSVVNHKLY